MGIAVCDGSVVAGDDEVVGGYGESRGSIAMGVDAGAFVGDPFCSEGVDLLGEALPLGRREVGEDGGVKDDERGLAWRVGGDRGQLVE